MDSEEAGRLFRLYGDDVYRLALSILGSRQDAEDVCQIVFLRLLEGRMRRQEGKERQWLLTCAANEAKSALRRLSRRAELTKNVPAPEAGTGEVLDAVWRLPEKYRAVIHLYCFEGLGQAQIADILKITRTAVQTRLSRARERLRKELQDDF